MRRLALLLAGGALWLVFAAAPAFADGGPHVMINNNGTAGLAADCAACHRAHTAQAADLLKQEVPALCLACHNGTGSTVDVVDGVQFAPGTWVGNSGGTPGHPDPAEPILGALRGGGFNYSLIGDPARLTYSGSRGVSFLGHVGVAAAETATTSNHMKGLGVVWGNAAQGSDTAGATGVVLDCTKCHNPHGNGQYRILNTQPGEDWSITSTTTTLSGALGTGTSPIGVASDTGFPAVQFTIKVDSEQMLVTAGFGGTTWTVTRGYGGTTAAIHASGTTVVLMWSAPATAVEVIDTANPTNAIRNYTILPSTTGLAADVVGTAAQGDYWRRNYDLTGATTWQLSTNLPDPMNTGWIGAGPNSAAALNPSVVTGPYAAIATTLSASINASVKAESVASKTGFPAAVGTGPQPVFIVQVGTELMTVTAIAGTGPYTFTITRGYGGTTAASHTSGDAVTLVDSQSFAHSLTADAYGLYNNLGRMTAWCIQCHTRYNGYSVYTDATVPSTFGLIGGSGASSLNEQLPADTTFMYKHGTTRIGCEQCHVSHGSNVTMSGPAASVPFPDGTAGGTDSRLLKVDNRGTCNLCHDPTGTVLAGVYTGPTPTPGL